MSGAQENTIEIYPKTQYLTASELVAQRHPEVESPRNGLKRTSFEGSAEENEELKNTYANLRLQLSARRIERQAGRAIAIWSDDQQAAEVVRKDGKFESFGYSQQGKLYLEYYEALFLLELNRLQLEYCGLIVSIEQAYVLLLGEEASEKYNNYFVYSALTRAGYIVVRHQEGYRTASSDVVTKDDCIWALLDASLSNKPVPLHIKVSQFYNATFERMVQLKQQIKNQCSEASTDEISINNEPNAFKFDTRKRRAQSEPEEELASKRASTTGRSLIDALKDEASYRKFQQTFEKLDIVRLQSEDYHCDVDSTIRTFKITFDLHLHNDGFRRSAPKTPTFSVIILQHDEPFPTHIEMLHCQRQQMRAEERAPLLVISVSESKHIQAFLYYIS
ncbi:PREDICTED: uncharacterized protein LOC108614465 [Drosophila arizonae]|uniref:Uncharacterized protein LOC108614465 n=1 Tax=Drosophila arizonae TaxID=7263 RepID=A0ABM1PA56_DROAR|nr:PREDICTED: uncharacterized protein LOC108614465 [Drosophila arizonae]